MDVLMQLLTLPTLFSFVFLCLSIYAVTLVIRSVVEGVWQKAKDNRYWREIFLPIGGIINGALLAGNLSFLPLPELLSAHVSNRILYGMVCGLFASFIYGRVKAWIKSKKG